MSKRRKKGGGIFYQLGDRKRSKPRVPKSGRVATAASTQTPVVETSATPSDAVLDTSSTETKAQPTATKSTAGERFLVYTPERCQAIAILRRFWEGWYNCSTPMCLCKHDVNGCALHMFHGHNTVLWCCGSRRNDGHAAFCKFDPTCDRELGYVELIAMKYLVNPAAPNEVAIRLRRRVFLHDEPLFVGSCQCDDALDCPYNYDALPELTPFDITSDRYYMLYWARLHRLHTFKFVDDTSEQFRADLKRTSTNSFPLSPTPPPSPTLKALVPFSRRHTLTMNLFVPPNAPVDTPPSPLTLT